MQLGIPALAIAARQRPQKVVFDAPLLTTLNTGIGAGTFTRNSTALDPDDYASVAIDVARFSADGWFGEPQRTNLALRSREFNHATWSKGGTITATADAVGIDGAANAAYTLTDSDAALGAAIIQSWTIANDSNPHTFSISIEKDNDETRFPEIQWFLTNGTGQFERVQLNTKTGATGVRLTSDGDHVVYDDGDFWRLQITVTNNSTGNTSAQGRLYPAVGHTTLGANFDATLTGSIVVDAAQLESGVTFATTPIHTTTAAATREADDLVYEDEWPADLVNDFVVAFDWTPSVDDQGAILLISAKKDGDENFLVWHDGTSIRAETEIGGSILRTTSALNYVAGTTYTIKARKSSTAGSDSWVDDVKGSGQAGATGDLDVGPDLRVGNQDSTLYQSGSIKNLRIVRGDLTDAEVVSL